MTKALSIPTPARHDPDVLAREIWDEFVRTIPAYAAVVGTPVQAEVLESSRRVAEVYLWTLDKGQLPRPRDVAQFGEQASHRVHQSFPLEAILRASRIEIQVLWRHIAGRTPPEEVAPTVALMLRLMDAIASAAENGYVVEREKLHRSREDATRLFLQRIVAGDYRSEVDGIETTFLGYDLDRLHTAVVIGPVQTEAPTLTASDVLLAQVGTRLRSSFPDCLSALLDSGYHFAIPTASLTAATKLVETALQKLPDDTVDLHAGLGSPRPGVVGLHHGFAEAHRALTLGAIVYPTRQIVNYEELRVFDLFKEGEVIDSFVWEALGPIIQNDEANHTHMVKTLHVYFETGMLRKATAARLKIHPNTLDYRLHQIEKVFGFALAPTNVGFTLPLALKLLPLSSFSNG